MVEWLILNENGEMVPAPAKVDAEWQGRRIWAKDRGFTLHNVVSLACEYDMIQDRNQFYEKNAKIQAAIVRQMLPYAAEIYG